MFFVEQFKAPLFEIDVQAWLFVAYIIGSTEIPSRDEMKKHISKQTMNELDVPETRKVMDSNYFLAWENLGQNHWSKNFTNPRGLSILEEYFTYYLRIMAQKMKDAQYPDDIGSLEKLNAKGEAIVKLDLESVLHRTSIPTDGPQVEWKTFRDADPSGIKSIHTGAEAAQLNSRWLHLENSAYDHLLQ